MQLLWKYLPLSNTNYSQKYLFSFLQNGTSTEFEWTGLARPQKCMWCAVWQPAWRRTCVLQWRIQFCIVGHVKKQNIRCWSSTNSLKLHDEKPLHCEPVMVWCAISGAYIIAPYFFEDKRVVTLIAAWHKSFLLPKLEEIKLDVWFQQDGATARINKTFEGVFFWGLILWEAILRGLCARLTFPCNFFSWDYLKAIVYNDRPKSLFHIKNNMYHR